MKFLFDATVMQQPATGVAKATLGLYNACFKQMSDIEVIALHRRKLHQPLPSYFRSTQYDQYLPDVLWRGISIPKYIYKYKPTFVHFPWNGNVPKIYTNTFVITTIHDVLPLIIPKYFKTKKAEEIYRKRVQTDINRSDLLITVSEFSKKELINNFQMEKEPLVLYHGPTIKKGHVFESESESNNYFLYVGGYDSRKGIEELVKIFIKLHSQKRLSSKLVLTGHKIYFSRELKNLIDKGRSLGIIHEKGYVSDEMLAILYSGAKALVYPSKYEGFGLPPLDAMALGCPVITTRYTSIPEVCGDSAFYIEPDNEKNFAEGLIALENDSDLCKRLQTNGIKQVNFFSWDKSAKIFCKNLVEMAYTKKVR